MGGIAGLQNGLRTAVSDVSRALSPDAAKVSRDVEDLVNTFGADTLRMSATVREQALKGAYSKGGPTVASALLARVAEGLDKTPLSESQVAEATHLVERSYGPMDNLKFTRGFGANEIRFSGDLYHIGGPARMQGTVNMERKTITRPFIEPTGDFGQMTAQEWNKGAAILKDAVAKRGLQPTGYTIEKTTVPGVLKYKFMPQPGQFEVGRLFLDSGVLRPIQK